MAKTCVNCKKKVSFFDRCITVNSDTLCTDCYNQKKKSVHEEIRKAKEKDDIRKYDGIIFDNTTKRVLCSGIRGIMGINYNSIVGYNLINEGHDEKKKHTLARATTGAILGGGIGAVVGAVSGKGKSLAYIDRLGVNVSLKNGGNFEIITIHTTSKTSSSRILIQENNEICSLLDSIITNNQAEYQSSNDNIDQLKKLKELVDQGVITQEDFETKKKQILGI